MQLVSLPVEVLLCLLKFINIILKYQHNTVYYVLAVRRGFWKLQNMLATRATRRCVCQFVFNCILSVTVSTSKFRNTTFNRVKHTRASHRVSCISVANVSKV